MSWLFTRADKNNDGHLSLNEVKEFYDSVVKLKRNVSFDEIIKGADTNQDGKIDY